MTGLRLLDRKNTAVRVILCVKVSIGNLCVLDLWNGLCRISFGIGCVEN